MPILAVLGSLALMVSLSGDTWIRFVVWMVIGLVVYVAFSRRRTRRLAMDDESR
ncbi:MAG: hypothetical protein M3P50_02750 [Actinomycetota bacterium]|nr:hypothetical protein [Actinomycetota bacterium]